MLNVYHIRYTLAASPFNKKGMSEKQRSTKNVAKKVWIYVITNIQGGGRKFQVSVRIIPNRVI